MLKDLMKSIFNEDVDLDEELTEEEPVEEVQEEPVSIEQPVKPTPPVHDDAVQEKVDVYSKEEQEAIIEQIVSAAKPEPKQQTLGSLDVDTVSRKEARATRRKTYHYDRRKIKSVRSTHTNANAEYQNVMSPIFGNTANSQKDFKKVHNAIDLEKPLKPDVFDEVISPMFGNDIPTVKPIEKIPTKDPENKELTPKPTSKKEPEAMELSEMIEKKAKTEKKPRQEKLFVSKN